MNRNAMVLALALFAFGCEPTKGDTGAWGGDDTSGGTSELSFAVTWGSSSVELSISDDEGRAFWFGMAETNAGCGDECWTGEDCLYGYTSPNTGTTYGPYCHDAGTEGISLTYGGDPTNLQEGTTVFPDSSYKGNVAYYFEDQDSGDCWVGGLNGASYYSGQGCTSVTVDEN